jgi:hypothetical protein
MKIHEEVSFHQSFMFIDFHDKFTNKLTNFLRIDLSYIYKHCYRFPLSESNKMKNQFPLLMAIAYGEVESDCCFSFDDISIDK